MREFAKPDTTLTQAVLNAGYDVTKRKHASEIGCQNLKLPQVRSRLQEILNTDTYDNEITKTWDEVYQQDVNTLTDSRDKERILNLKLKANDQLIRLKGLNPPSQSERRELRISAKTSWDKILPKGDSTANNPPEPQIEVIKEKE